jgi:CubicO group peptidase (beta-lactamase class C family)
MRGASAQEACDPAVRMANAPQELCDLAERVRATHSDAAVVLHRGKTILEYASPDGPGRIHVMSVTKSVVALAVGRMLTDGTLDSLDLPLAELVPEWRQGRKRDITVRHLLTHTSGIQDVANAGLEIEPAPDAVRLAIAAELEADPGAVFRYNNKAVNLLALVVERLTGMALDEYLRTTLFADLGILDVEWIHDPAGNPYVMAGLTIGARDLAKLGQLVLQEGVWEGERIVDAGFIRAATTPRHALHPRHGYLWWLMREDGGPAQGWYGDGWLGQWLVVVPDQDLVAVRLIDRATWQTDEDTFTDFRERVRELRVGD